MNYDDTKFVARLKKFGIKRILFSVDLRYSALISILIIFIIHYFGIAGGSIVLICPLYITISAAMIAVAIAGLAIIASISDPKFVLILKNSKIYENILFTFWYSTIISGISIISNIITYILPLIFADRGVLPIYTISLHQKDILLYSEQIYITLFFISTFFVLYSVFAVILLVGTTMRYGLYRGEFVSRKYYDMSDETKPSDKSIFKVAIKPIAAKKNDDISYKSENED